jgi:hypothetical protein
MQGAQEFISGLLGSIGFQVEVVRTDLHPIVLAHRGGDPRWPHVVIYGHYDVQPAETRVSGDAGMTDEFLQFGDGVEHGREGYAGWPDGGQVPAGGKAGAPKRPNGSATGARYVSV